MSKSTATVHYIGTDSGAGADPHEDILNRTFFALSDPVRRALLQRLEAGPALVSELAEPFDISLQAVSRHIQVLVRAGLVGQERSGRISRCSLLAEPIVSAAVWINRYSKYWQGQFDLLAAVLGDIEKGRSSKRASGNPRAAAKKATRRAKGSRNE